MAATHHWFDHYPKNLRRSFYAVLALSWLVILSIIGHGKFEQLQVARRPTEQGEGMIIIPCDTIHYSEMTPPPSISGFSSQTVAEAEMPGGGGPRAVEDITSSVPLPVPDEQAEVATMATQSAVLGLGVGPPGTGPGGASVFILPETTKQVIVVYGDIVPAPVIFKYMKASVMPQPLKDAQPEYPEKARLLGIEGLTIIDMWLRKDGTVSVIQVHKSSENALLDSAAAQAALKSTFTPARGADGNPVNVWVRRPFRFSLTR